MNSRTLWWIALGMFAAGAALRINNALVFSPVRAYDGFAHFSYIWFLAENWIVPLPTSGWEFFQPPLYYAWMAWLWNALAPMDAILRLQLGTLVMAVLGLVHAWASWVLVRRVLPDNPVARLAAAGLMLFLPVHLYSAGFIGNEYLCAVFCSLSLVALMRVIDRPTVANAIVLGLCLGAAMLTKFTAFVVVAGAFATLGGRAILRRDRTGLGLSAVAAAAMILVCGWFYGRNILIYGTPFKMSRETFVLQRYENMQTKGRRTIWEYVLFDPVILRRPQWPRAVPLVEEIPTEREYSAARESVLTGIYANAWFDGYGGWVLPAVHQDNTVRRAGQILLTLGLVPSILCLVGIAVAVRRLWQRGWDDTLVAMVSTFAAMLAVLVQGTIAVPVHAAVKATYLLPVSAVFGFWFGLGLDWIQRRRARWFRPILATCAVLALVSVTVFFQGRTIATYWFGDDILSPLWRNTYGVIYHAAGDDERARTYLESAAADDYHLAWENLAQLVMKDEPLRAVHYLRRALALQPSQSMGTPWDRELFNRNTAAEYMNTLSVLYHRLGWTASAEQAAEFAVHADPNLPEATYDLAVLRIGNAFAARDDEYARSVWIARARRLLFDTLVLDPAFIEALRLSGMLEAFEGRCDAATMLMRNLQGYDEPRLYPVDTGIGDLLAASIKRRRHLTALPPELTAEFQIARCNAGAGPHVP